MATKTFPIPVTSHLDSVTYDTKKDRLVVGFDSGARYAYSGVSDQRFTQFAKAESKGGYLHHKIVPNYPDRKLSNAQ